jgi:hypothetical protein
MSEKIFIVIIFLSSLVLSFSYDFEVQYYGALTHIYKHFSPMVIYKTWAMSISNGDLSSKEISTPYYGWMTIIGTNEDWQRFNGKSPFYFPPLYPYFVALIFFIFGNNEILVFLFQALINSMIVVLIFFVSKYISGEHKAVPFIASLSYSFYKTGIFYSGLLISNTIIKFLLVLMVLFFSKYKFNEKKTFFLFVPGLICGLLILSSFLGWFILIGIFIYIQYLSINDKKKLAVMSLAFLLGTSAIMILPVARNMALGNAPLSLSSTLPWKFAAGNMQGTSSVGFNPPREFLDLVKSGQNRFFSVFLRTLSTHKADPLGLLELIRNKIIAFFKNSEITEHENIYDNEIFSKILIAIPLTFGILMPVAFVGLIFMMKKEFLMMHILSASVFINSIFLYYDSSQRDLLSPFLVIYAGFGTCVLFEKVIEKSKSSLIWIFITFAVLYIFTFNPSTYENPKKDPFVYYKSIAKSDEVSGLDEYAEKLYKIAIMNNPGSYDGYFNLGRFYFQRRQYTKGSLEFEKVISIKSDVEYAHGFLGLCYFRLYQKDPKLNKVYLDKACSELNEEVRKYPAQDEIWSLIDRYCQEVQK